MSKSTEKKLCQYAYLLEKLLILIMDNNEKKRYDMPRKLDKLINILAKGGLTQEEIESAAMSNEPYDNNLENLSEDLVNEYIPNDINNISISDQKEIIEYIQQQHIKLKQLGINLIEEQTQK